MKPFIELGYFIFFLILFAEYFGAWTISKTKMKVELRLKHSINFKDFNFQSKELGLDKLRDWLNNWFIGLLIVIFSTQTDDSRYYTFI